MLNGPLVISLQYHRENENMTIFLWKRKKKQLLGQSEALRLDSQTLVGYLREVYAYSSPLVLKVIVCKVWNGVGLHEHKASMEERTIKR